MSEVTGIKGLSFKAAFFLGQKEAELKNAPCVVRSPVISPAETVDFLEILSWRPQLLARVQEFAHRPQLWIHPTRLDCENLADGSERLQRRTAERLNQSFNLPELDYEVYENESWRFSLLDYDQLEQIARWAGLYNLSTVMESEPVDAISAQLGPDDYETIVNLAPIICGADFEATSKIPGEWMVNIEKSARYIGWFTIGSVFSKAPKSIVKRFELKLPEDVAEVAKSGRKKAIVRPRNVGDFLIRILKNNIDRNEAICIF